MLAFLMFALSGCAATMTAIEHRNLEVSSNMSDTVFLDPVRPELKTVFLQIKNTSDKDIDLTSVIASALVSKGYRLITVNPDKAHYLLQANVLYAGKARPIDLRQALAGGYGSNLGTMIVGGIAGAGIGHSIRPTGSGPYAVGAALGVVAAGMAERVASSFVKNVTYSIVTDIQLSERTKGKVKQEITSDLSQGSQTKIKQTMSTSEHFKRFRTRVVSSANKVNLDFEDAVRPLQLSIGKAIAGIL